VAAAKAEVGDPQPEECRRERTWISDYRKDSLGSWVWVEYYSSCHKLFSSV